VAACHGGYSLLYATLDDLARRLGAADAAGRLPSQLKAYSRPALLVIDLCRPGNYAEMAGRPSENVLTRAGLWGAGRTRRSA